MLIRIVRMTFREEEVGNFLSLFDQVKSKIRAFEGCQHLELWQDYNEDNVYLTYSIWDTQEHLDHYRFSELFKDTWSRTKVLFAEKPRAFSSRQYLNVEE